MTGRKRGPRVGAWALGCLASLGVAWLASALFMNSLLIPELDPETGFYAAPPGYTYHHRSEGFARTVFGRHGISGLEDAVALPGPKVLFWGDSFVEGLQVDDEDKMAQAFTRLAREHGLDALGVGLGASGERMADYYFKIPVYEKLLGPAAVHCIVLAGLGDTLPDNQADCHSSLVMEPEPRLIQSSCTPGRMARTWGPLLTRLRLQGVYDLYQRARDLDIRLEPGTEQTARQADPADTATDPEPAWDFLLARLRAQTDLPLVIAYVPPTSRSLEEQDRARAFAQACADHNVGFLDLGPAIERYRAENDSFARGFANTPPGQGHLNPAGHLLVARAVLDHIQSHALLPR